MTSRLRIAALVALVILAGAGCGVPLDGQPRDIDVPGIGPSRPPPEGYGSAAERLYLVRDGRLVRALRRITVPPTPQQMLQHLLAGPTAAERADGLTSAVSTMEITGMAVAGRRATVAIGARSGARSDEVLAYGQIVCTLTSQGADVGTVSFTSAGRPLGVPRADGSLSTGPLTIADYAVLLD